MYCLHCDIAYLGCLVYEKSLCIQHLARVFEMLYIPLINTVNKIYTFSVIWHLQPSQSI